MLVQVNWGGTLATQAFLAAPPPGREAERNRQRLYEEQRNNPTAR